MLWLILISTYLDLGILVLFWIFYSLDRSFLLLNALFQQEGKTELWSNINSWFDINFASELKYNLFWNM